MFFANGSSTPSSDSNDERSLDCASKSEDSLICFFTLGCSWVSLSFTTETIFSIDFSVSEFCPKSSSIYSYDYLTPTPNLLGFAPLRGAAERIGRGRLPIWLAPLETKADSSFLIFWLGPAACSYSVASYFNKAIIGSVLLDCIGLRLILNPPPISFLVRGGVLTASLFSFFVAKLAPFYWVTINFLAPFAI